MHFQMISEYQDVLWILNLPIPGTNISQHSVKNIWFSYDYDPFLKITLLAISVYQESWNHYHISVFWIFYELFDCPTPNFGPLLRGKLFSPNINHCILIFFNLARVSSGVWTGIFLIWSQCLNPLGHSPQYCLFLQ